MRFLISILITSIILLIPDYVIAPDNRIQSYINSCRVNEYTDISYALQNSIIRWDRVMFMWDVGFRESSNNYEAVNSFGFLGMYQFSPATLRGLGINVDVDTYLTTPSLQDSAFIELLRHNHLLLHNYIVEYDGTMFGSHIITKSGILASAHLIGPTRTRELLRHGLDFQDGYGTSASEYLINFSGYNLQL
jgi:hypothetical protein